MPVTLNCKSIPTLELYPVKAARAVSRLELSVKAVHAPVFAVPQLVILNSTVVPAGIGLVPEPKL